jgi:Cu(I)/Ag(I) efflux system membrane fusion protein
MNTKPNRIAAIFLTFSIIIGIGTYLVRTGEDGQMIDTTTVSPLGSSERQPLYWVAPMDANYRRDEPGLSPMGMALIPVYDSGDTITVSSSIQQNLGVRTAQTRREDFSPTIKAVGHAAWDEASIQMLHTRAAGWLEIFNLASVGDNVVAGEILYELFAPNLVSVQREYLTASASGNRQLTSIAKDRLFAFGFTLQQVEDLESTQTANSRMVARAERDATITHIGVRQGNYVEPSTQIAALASLDRVWIEAEVFESKASWIQPGLPAEVSFTAFPGETWKTEIDYVYPNLESTTRSLRLRLILDNSDHRLRPNMFASVQITAKPKVNVLTVPREAVIRAGQGERVMVALGDGGFRPQVVQTGIVSNGRIEILTGLREGETVVTSGQFLLDSEANGEQAFARLSETDGGMRTEAMAMPMPETLEETSVDRTDVRTVYSTVGVIRQIAVGATITIAHQPVEMLDWPAMTMAFQLPDQLNISSFSIDETVVFEFSATPSGSYEIIKIAAVGESQ